MSIPTLMSILTSTGMAIWCTPIRTAIPTRIRIIIHTNTSTAPTTSTMLCMKRTHPMITRILASMARTITLTMGRAVRRRYLLWMRMKMVPGIGVVAVPVHLGIQRDRNKAHLTVRDPALRDDAIGEVSHRPGLSAKHGHLETVLVIEMHVHRRNVEVMVIVMRGCEPFRQFAGVMVEHVRERCETLAAAFRIQSGVLQAKTGEVSQGFRAIDIACALHEGAELCRKLVGHADRNALHCPLPFFTGLVR